MAQYAVLKDGVIEELHDSIPNNWKNVSGFNLMTDEERKNHGFVVVKQEKIATYDPEFDILTADHIVENGTVIYREEITKKYTEEQEKEYKRNILLNNVRLQRNQLLSTTDWAVMPDVVANRGQAWADKYYSYRQKLRDITNNLPEQYSEVVWPTLEQ